MPTSQRKSGEEVAADAVIRTLLLTDLVDSTKLVEKLGDARAYEVASRHDRVARDLLPRWNGLEIDKTDGFLLLFERPLDAVGYALAYHKALAELSVELGAQLRSRAGIHLGEVFLRENDPEDVARGAKPLEVEGLAKPTAARAMSLAGGKQTLLTQGAFDLAREAAVDDETFGGKLRWLAHGPYRFKGVDEPVEIFEVGVDGAAPLVPPADTAKARRAVVAGDEVTLGWRPGPGLEIPRRPGWRLDQRLGEGGFGEVWLATQKSTAESRVFKFCYDAKRLRALQREVTLFRLLKESLGDAPEILRIYDWNFEQAPYYLEAEHVAGGNLIEWTEERGGLSEISLPDRLEIVAQIADALAAAHSVGVLHKDVKPANVLIAEDRDSRPRAKLTDFGIGEVVDQSELLAKGITVLGMTEVVAPSDSSSSVTGSHLYIAPEVSEGKTATVQADVYALGVMLYQIAVGDFRRALAPGWRRDVEDELLAEDIAGFVDGSPENRPASAREVAERLRGLQARRAERQARRRAREDAEAARVALVQAQRRRKITAIFAAVATAFLTVVSILAVQAMRARDEAEAARGISEQRRDQAEGLISFMLGDLREKLEPVGRLDILDSLGQQAMEYFASVPEEVLSDEELARRSKALYQIGDLRIKQGDLQGATVPLRESLTLAQSLVERAPEDPERRFGLGQSYFWVGYVLWEQGDLEGALAKLEEYYRISEQLAKESPTNEDWKLELAYAHTNLGLVLEAKGEYERALAEIRRSNHIKEELLLLDPSDAKRRRSVANGLSWLARALERNGDLPAALEQYQAELEIRQSLAEQDPRNTDSRYLLSLSHSHVSDLLLVIGRSQEALTGYKTAIDIMHDLAATDPQNAKWRRHLAISHRRVGKALMELQSSTDATPHFNAGRNIFEDLIRSDSSNKDWQQELARAYYQEARASLVTGRPADSLTSAHLALDTLNSILHAEVESQATQLFRGRVYILLGRVHEQLGQNARAKEYWNRAIKNIETIARGSKDAKFLEAWATPLLYLDRVDEAVPIVSTLVSSGFAKADFVKLCEEKGVVGCPRRKN